MAKSIAVRWFGPYDHENAALEVDDGLYLCWGRQRMGPSIPRQLLYCGISENEEGIGARIEDHFGREFAHYSNEWWVGRVFIPEDHDRSDLELAEWMITFFLQPRHARKKRKNPPHETCYLVNEWYTVAGGVRKRLRGAAAEVHDVLCWDAEEGVLRFCNQLQVVT